MTFKDRYGDHSNEVYEGVLICISNELTSLEGCYKEVQGSFYCSQNQLESLEHGPAVVNGDFYCSQNDLKTLEGAPKIVNGKFYCKNNIKLTSLDDLLESEIKGKIISDLDSNFKKKQLLYKKLGKKRYEQYMYLSQEL